MRHLHYLDDEVKYFLLGRLAEILELPVNQGYDLLHHRLVAKFLDEQAGLMPIHSLCLPFLRHVGVQFQPLLGECRYKILYSVKNAKCDYLIKGKCVEGYFNSVDQRFQDLMGAICQELKGIGN